MRETAWLGLAMALAAAVPAASAGGARVSAGPQAEVALLAGWAEPDGRRIAGVSIALAPGWKTYWRSPGESGLPPVLDWSGSSNLAAVAVEWPAPEVFDTYGMTTLGYDGSVVLPLAVTPADPTAPVTLALSVRFGVCKDICLPASADLALRIEPGAKADGGEAIRAFRQRVPVPAAEAGVSEAACAVRGAGADRRFEARLRMARPSAAVPVMVVEGPADVWFGPVAARRDGAVLVGEADVHVYGEGVWIGRDSLRLTLLWPDRAVDVRGCGPL